MYDPTDKNIFEVEGRGLKEWKGFYHDAQEMMPWNIPQVFDKYVVIKYYVDENHAEKNGEQEVTLWNYHLY